MNKNAKLRQVGVMLLAGMMLSSSTSTYAITYKDENGKKVEIDEFKDVKTHWARNIIREWNDLGIVNGDDKGNFNPNANITRGDLACMIDRLLGLKATAVNTFNDLPANKYYTPSVLRMNAEGLLSGDGKNLRPQDNATREEVVSILTRAFKIDTSKTTGYSGFVDDYKISSWARASVETMNKLGYVGGVGNGKFEPKRPITRAEVVAIIDKICETYYTKTSSSSKEFTNIGNGNAVVAMSGITIKRSTIGNNLYLTQSATGTTTIDATTIDGSVIVLGDGSKIDAKDNSFLNDLICYGVTTVDGANMFSSIYIDKFASGSSLDVIPKEVIIAPLSSVKIEGVLFRNESSEKELTYTQNELKNLMSEDKNKVEGGPEIKDAQITISYDNNVKAKGVKLKTTGNSDLDEIGVIWNEGSKTPTIEDYDDREEYRGYNSDGIDFFVDTQDKDEYYTYRVYAINEEGLVGYSDPVTLRSYDFDIEMMVSQTGSGIRPELHITGDSVPAIKSVDFKYDNTHVYTEGKPVQKGRSDTDVSADNTQDYQQYRYFTDIKLDEGYAIPPFYGYVIEFKDAGKIDKFPVLSNITPDSIKPVESIETGTGSQSGTKIYVDDNKIVSSFSPIQEYGIVYKEVRGGNVGLPDATSGAWETVVEGYDIPNKTTKYFDSDFYIDESDSDVYFASYVKSNDGYYYGSLKSIKNNHNDGDIGSPQVEKVVANRLSGNLGMVTIEYNSDSAVDLNSYGSIISFKDNLGNAISQYNGGSLKNADAWVSLGKNKIVLLFDGLRDSYSYTGTIKLPNEAGSSKKVNFNLGVTPLTVKPIVDTSNAKMDMFSINLAIDSNIARVVNASIDGNALGISGNDRVGYTATSKKKLDKGTYPMTITFEHHISKEQSNVKVIKFTRTVNVTIN